MTCEGVPSGCDIPGHGEVIDLTVYREPEITSLLEALGDAFAMNLDTWVPLCSSSGGCVCEEHLALLSEVLTLDGLKLQKSLGAIA